MIFLVLLLLWLVYGPLTSLVLRRRVPLVEEGFALSFDDGPTEVTGELLDFLEKEGIRARFFVLGKKVKGKKDLLKKMSRRHAVGIHGYAHINYMLSGPLTTKKDFYKGLDALKKEGITPKYFRAPYGAYNLYLYHLIRKEGLEIVGWDHLLGDWEMTDPEVLAEKLYSFRNEGLLVLHDGTEGTANPRSKEIVVPALTLFFERMKADGSSK